jgi:hypothetical protein
LALLLLKLCPFAIHLLKEITFYPSNICIDK